MATSYRALLISNGTPLHTPAQCATILDCVKYAEASGTAADCVDIYRANGTRVAQYRKPKPGTYPASIGVWVNAKIY